MWILFIAGSAPIVTATDESKATQTDDPSVLRSAFDARQNDIHQLTRSLFAASQNTCAVEFCFNGCILVAFLHRQTFRKPRINCRNNE